MLLLTRLLRTATATLNWLTRPPHQLIDMESQQNARLLSWLLLATVTGVSLIIVFVMSFDPKDLSDLRTLAAFSVMIIAALLYIVNRIGYVNWAVFAFIACLTIIFIAVAYMGEFPEFMPFVVVPLLLAGMFYSFNTTMVFMLAIISLIFALNHLRVDAEIWNRRIIWYFLLFAGGLILVFKYHLGVLEKIRQRRLEEVNAEREQQQLQLTLEKERGEMFRALMSNIAHDIKTPLTIINTSLYLLEKFDDPVKRQQKVDSIKAQVEVLGSFIQDLMLIARLDGEPKLQLTFVDLNELLMTIEKDYNDLVEKRCLTFTLDLEDTIPLIHADQGDLRRALTNLIENGINYTPEGGGVTVKTRQQAKNIMVEVADTGIGIDKESLQHIFERFYRSTEAKTLVSSGSGLGLAIVKRILEMHGGTVEVESVVNQGTTFRMLLPVQHKVS
jgi:signal transduction histidine kinase